MLRPRYRSAYLCAEARGSRRCAARAGAGTGAGAPQRPPVRRGTALVPAAEWAALLADSHQHLTGRPLLPELASLDAAKDAERIYDRMSASADCILSHDLPADSPRFNWANARGLAAFEYDLETLVTIESRKSAPDTGTEEERARLLEAVRRQGFIDDYCGVRISASGRTFMLNRATVWNVVDTNGELVGQAAKFHFPDESCSE